MTVSTRSAMVAIGVLVSLALLVVLSAGTSSADLDVPPVQDVIDNHLQDMKIHATTEIIKQMLTKRCIHHYTVPCMKLDLARLVDRISGSPSNYQLLPGVSLSSRNTTPSEDLPAELAQALARDRSSSSLDDFLIAKLGRYLSSLTLSVRLAEPVEYLANKALAARGDEGRGGGGNRRRNYGLMAAALFSAGTLLTLGLAALAAMSGKAMMTSMAALLLAALTAMKGHGSSDHKSTTYEIITKPVVSHAHTHSAEVQHEHGGGGHHYAYGRSMEFSPVLPVGSEADGQKDSMSVAYRAHRPSHPRTYTAEDKEE